MATDYKDKIRKLLALAESPVEAEAKIALLKARELMAKHKLTEAELGEAENQAVKNILTDITCSKRRDPWIINLSAVIGENYCCTGYRSHNPGQQTQRIGFIGLEEDVEICTAIFKYAVDCALSEIKRLKKECRSYPTGYVKSLCDSYGYGFTAGVSEAFRKQQEDNKEEWSLVLVMPQEVINASQHLGREEFKASTQEKIDPFAYKAGHQKGSDFDPKRRLTEEVNIS